MGRSVTHALATGLALASLAAGCVGGTRDAGGVRPPQESFAPLDRLDGGRVVQLHLLLDEAEPNPVALSRALDRLIVTFSEEDDVIAAWQRAAGEATWIAAAPHAAAEQLMRIAARRMAIVAPEAALAASGEALRGDGLFIAAPSLTDGVLSGFPPEGTGGLVVADLSASAIDGDPVALSAMLAGESRAVRAASAFILEARRHGELPDRVATLAAHGFDADRFEWLRVAITF